MFAEIQPFGGALPTQLEVRFVSSNKYKIREAAAILGAVGVTVTSSAIKIEELQTEETERLVRDKLLKAFNGLGRPLFVEHTGLYLAHLNGFPGGLTQIFWDTLGADLFSELFGKLAPVKTAIARTVIGYCDGKKIHSFNGEIAGVIVPEPRGPIDFQWDCVFQPEGYSKTFAEMGDEKNKISMRRQALDKFAAHLGAGA
jgi:XTP/dITP diphosphohydrolase